MRLRYVGTRPITLVHNGQSTYLAEGNEFDIDGVLNLASTELFVEVSEIQQVDEIVVEQETQQLNDIEEQIIQNIVEGE